MALRVLTNEERLLLAGSPEFSNKVKMAVRDAGDYWSINDGSTMTGTLAERLTWAKNRFIGVGIVLNDSYVNNTDLVSKAIKASKGMQFDLEAAPQSVENILLAITPVKYEEIAALLMDIFGEDLNGTIGGN